MQPLLPSFQRLSLTSDQSQSVPQSLNRKTHAPDFEWGAFYNAHFNADFNALAEAAALGYVSPRQLQSHMLLYQMQNPSQPIQHHLWCLKNDPARLKTIGNSDLTTLMDVDVNARITWIDVNIEGETSDAPSLPPGWLWYLSRNGTTVYIGPRYSELNSTPVYLANSAAMAWAIFLCIAIYDPTVLRDDSWMGVKLLVRSAKMQHDMAYLKRYMDLSRTVRVQNTVTQQVSNAVLEHFRTGGASSAPIGDAKSDTIHNAASIVVSDLMKTSKKRTSGARHPNQPSELAKQAKRAENALERERKREEKQREMERKLEEKQQRTAERSAERLAQQEAKQSRLLQRQSKREEQLEQDVFKVLDKMITKVEREFAKTQASELKRSQKLLKASAQAIDHEADQAQSALERTTRSMMNSVIKRVLLKARTRHNTYLKRQTYLEEKNSLERLLDQLEEEGNEAMMTTADIADVELVLESIKSRLAASKEAASSEELKERIENEIVATVDAFETFLRKRRKDECIKSQRIAYEQRATQATISGSNFVKALEHLLDPQADTLDEDLSMYRELVMSVQSSIPKSALTLFVTLVKAVFVGDDPAKLHSWNSIKDFTTEHLCQHTKECSTILTYMDELFHSKSAIAHMCDEYDSDNEYELDDDESGDELNSNVDEDEVEDDASDGLEGELDGFFDDSELDAEENALAMMNMEKLSVMMQSGRIKTNLSDQEAALQQQYVESALAPDKFELMNQKSLDKAFARQQNPSTSKATETGTKRRIIPQLIQPFSPSSKQARVDALWHQTQMHFTHHFLSENVADVLNSIRF